MKKLYAPWRNAYSTKITEAKDTMTSQKDCVFCQQFKENNDAQYFILGRFDHSVVIMNLYPYNAGHLLLLPQEHLADLEELSLEAQYELIELTTHCVTILKKALGAQGINVGLNLGKAAGAGIPSHLHTHILPRWRGDTNFLPLLAQTKQISTDLHEIYSKLLPHFQKITKKKKE